MKPAHAATSGEPQATDIIDRLRGACVGHPNAQIAWPHRLLHDAIKEIQRLRMTEAAAAPDHALYARAITAGVIRWEWLPSRTSGEVCVGGMRWATHLDEFGVPVLHDSLRAAIAKATEGGGE